MSRYATPSSPAGSQPGAKIKINDAAAEYEFSPGAVREALSRLAAERMAVATAQKGFTVAAISAEELVDLTRTRIAIEQLCLRSAVGRGDVEVGGDHHRRLSSAASPADRRIARGQAFESCRGCRHNAFHAALTSACESRWSWTIREMLYAQSERYRSLSKIVDNERDIDSEHKGLLDACLSRDADLACERIRSASVSHDGDPRICVASAVGIRAPQHEAGAAIPSDVARRGRCLALPAVVLGARYEMRG